MTLNLTRALSDILGLFTTTDQLRHRSGKGWIPKRLLILFGVFLLFVGSRAEPQNVYRWIDENGKIHLVDQLGEVPKAYRDRLKVYRVSSGQKKRSDASGPEDSGTVSSEVSQGGETSPTSPDRPVETSTALETLRRRETSLEQEKARLRVLETRFRTKKSRSVIYSQRIEEIDNELEAVKKEIDKNLRSVP